MTIKIALEIFGLKIQFIQFWIAKTKHLEELHLETGFARHHQRKLLEKVIIKIIGFGLIDGCAISHMRQSYISVLFRALRKDTAMSFFEHCIKLLKAICYLTICLKRNSL